jgi:hypothetical protein
MAYPVFLAGRLLGPNAAVRHWIRDLERGIHAALGQPSRAQRLESLLAVGAALWTGLTLKCDLFQHPRLTRTAYRMADKHWSALDLWEELRRVTSSPEFSVQVELQHAKQHVWLRLEGALSAADAAALAQRISDSLARSKSRLLLDLHKLHWDKIDNLQPLRNTLAAYRERIRLVLPDLAVAHPELALLAGMFELYTG